MGYKNHIGQIATGTLSLTSTPKIAWLQGTKLQGVHTIEIYADSADCYYGNKDVTVANGFPIKRGEAKILPVRRNSDNIYLVGSGTVRIALYTE